MYIFNLRVTMGNTQMTETNTTQKGCCGVKKDIAKKKKKSGCCAKLGNRICGPQSGKTRMGTIMLGGLIPMHFDVQRDIAEKFEAMYERKLNLAARKLSLAENAHAESEYEDPPVLAPRRGVAPRQDVIHLESRRPCRSD